LGIISNNLFLKPEMFFLQLPLSSKKSFTIKSSDDEMDWPSKANIFQNILNLSISNNHLESSNNSLFFVIFSLLQLNALNSSNNFQIIETKTVFPPKLAP